MAGPDLISRLKKKFGDGVVGANTEAVDPWIEVSPSSLVAVCEFLKAEPDLQFDMLNCISGVDYCEPDPKKAAKVPTDITEDVVRAVALPTGLVDNKVCAVDEVWSGLRLVVRRELR